MTCRASVCAAAIAPASSVMGCTIRSGSHSRARGTSSKARRGAAAPNIPAIAVGMRRSGGSLLRSETARNAASASARLGPTCQVGRPRRCASATPSAPLATTTR